MTIGGQPAEQWGEETKPEPDAFAASADARNDAWALLDQDYGDEVDVREEKVERNCLRCCSCWSRSPGSAG
jgi:hypothetical protein